MELQIEEALEELKSKTEEDIEKETALKWSARAIAAFILATEASDPDEKAYWVNYGDELRHEALEHAALFGNFGGLVGDLQREVDKYRAKAEPRVVRADTALANAPSNRWLSVSSSDLEALGASLEAKYEVQITLLFKKGQPEDEVPPAIKIDGIFLPKSQRSLGIGSKVMQEIVDFADDHGCICLLTPSKDFGATSVNRLRKFYGRFGFKRNLGRNKDFRYTEAMIRPPRARRT